MCVAQRLLQRVQRIRRAHALDRLDLVAVRLDAEQQAAAHRLAVEEHRAHTADAVFAGEMRAGQAE
jgi:hypothetical protein